MLGPEATLIRWLGPWSREAPRSPTRTEILVAPGLRGWLYWPARAPLAAYLVSPGLHPHGPADPRMDRLGRVLAAAGFLVLAPFLPAHLEVRASATATADLMLAFDHLETIARREGLSAPSVFSVSFGSNPAIALCGDPRYAHRVRGLFLFGGFADFTRVCRFAALGEWEHERLPYDPTNLPAVFLNLVDHLGVAEAERAPLAAAWREMCVRTWNRDELKHVTALRPIAERLAEPLPAPLRPLFLAGCGVAAGTREHLLSALAFAAPHLAFADPRTALAGLAAPIVIAHGRSDAVVCVHEAAALRALLPAGHPHRYFITGMFGHGTARIPSPRAVATEVRTLLAMTRAMATLPLGAL